jgi:hypothetical protein
MKRLSAFFVLWCKCIYVSVCVRACEREREREREEAWFRGSDEYVTWELCIFQVLQILLYAYNVNRGCKWQQYINVCMHACVSLWIFASLWKYKSLPVRIISIFYLFLRQNSFSVPKIQNCENISIRYFHFSCMLTAVYVCKMLRFDEIKESAKVKQDACLFG